MSLSIVQVATAFRGWGVTEFHILEISDQLRQRGHQVVIACQPDSWVEQRAAQMELATVPLTITRQYDTQDFGKLRRLLRTNEVDVVHVHERQDIAIYSIAAMLERVPVRVMTRHLTHRLNNKHGSWLYSNVFLSHTLAPSSAVKKTLVESGMTSDRIEVVPLGMNYRTISADARPVWHWDEGAGRDQERVVVGFVGRMGRGKGLLDFVDAAERLKHIPKLRYAVVGEGPDEDVIQGRVNDAGLIDRFQFAPFKSDIESYIAGMDVVVVPTSYPEVCATVLQCAMALGKPVIATCLGVHLDLVHDGVDGLLIPPADPTSLADAIARLAEDKPLRQRLGAEAHRVSAPSAERMLDKIEALYHSTARQTRDAPMWGRRGRHFAEE